MIYLLIICLLLILCLLIIQIFHNLTYQKRIQELTDYLEKVNLNSPGIILPTKEDSFSHLQDEIYKTVTSLRQAKDEAQAAQMQFAQNLANIAHQLKTPITAASLSVQLLEQNGDSAYTDQISRQLTRLTTLEESLLILSQLDAGVLILKQQTIDLYTVLNLASDNLEPLLKEAEISVFIPDKGCIEINGDLDWTMEALMNLMKNCIEHSPKGSQIHCDYADNPLYSEIMIWDDGDGFAKEDLPYLFQRFYRGSSPSGSGIGIGLSLSRAIFEMENAHITAFNRNEGGACFQIRFYNH